ncbi:MAG: C25 family cysteine peptidase, partial [Promethearchaeota archaeon]
MHKKYLILILTISMTLLPLLNIEGQKFNVFVPQSNDTNSLTTKQGGSIYNNTVLVLMNTTLNSSIYNEVSTFVQDIINGLKCNASLYVYPNSWTPSNLRNFLNNTYQNFGLRGAILIGQAPAFFYEHIYQVPAVKYFRFPWDYYYMDLDCKFTDLDGNLTADSMSGNIGPEIWVSRIDAHKLSNEVNLYKDFFARNNLV